MRFRLLLAPAALALLATANAQGPAAWADLPVPGGVDPVRLDSRGKLVTYHDGNVLRVFSAAHRRWRSTAAAANAPRRLMNDCLLVQDGPTWTAFSSYTGQFAPLSVSPGAQLLNPSSQNNDSILLVLDGTTLYAFSCFTGSWTSRAVTANTGFAVQRHVALLSDGTLLSGMDAYTGQWHDTIAATTPQVLDCDGSAAVAVDASSAAVYAFSALHRTWRANAGLANAQFARDDDWCLFWTGGQMLAYSGVTGRFATFGTGASAVPFRRDLCALIDTPAGLRAYSAIHDSLSPPLASSGATARAGSATAILVDGLQVTGFSAVTGDHATITLDSAAEAVAATVATAVDNATGRPLCYSALLGTWHQAPLDTLPGVPQVTATDVLLPASSGAYAFSSRTGSFVPLASTGVVLLGNDQSSVGAAWDGASLHAFDSRTDTWRSVARTGSTPPIVQIWRTSMFAVDGAVAHGFGAQGGTWSSVAMPEPYVAGRASSESARVTTATHVLAHAPLPPVSVTAQFPEFRRVQPTGADARFSVALDGGGVAVLAGGVFAATPTAVSGLGDFWLAAPLATILLAAPPGAERATFALAVPQDPGLAGLQLAFQALAVPTHGTAHLGGAIGLYVP